ncbi:MAG: hypothetical protein LBK69_07935, partial [Syntrophomonadaceae bacterium]|nr:hypothetical protein [Syntrophomonadaceae bacterium]
ISNFRSLKIREYSNSVFDGFSTIIPQRNKNQKFTQYYRLQSMKKSLMTLYHIIRLNCVIIQNILSISTGGLIWPVKFLE